MKTPQKTRGQAPIVARSVAKRPKLRQRTRVLIVLNSDGFVEVYGEGLSVHIAQRLTVDGNAAEATDEYLDSTLPKAFRDLFYPVKRLAVGQCRRITAAEELDRLVDMAVLRGCELTAPAVPAAIAKARRARQ